MNSAGVNTMTSAVTCVKTETPAIVLTNCDSGGTVLTDLDSLAISNGGTYNLNVNVNVSTANTTVSQLLASEAGSTTPRTPEILNSVIAMTNPLDQYAYGDKHQLNKTKGGSGNDSNSSISNGSSKAASPSPATTNAVTSSVQKTCSELIKAGLKLSIESKRKFSGSEGSESGTGSFGCYKRLKKEEDPSDEDYDSSHTQVSRTDCALTPEDEERRRRRRERNKIAATKCRLKKREKTVNLVTESEVLEQQNIDLKTEFQELELQRKQLSDMLSLHSAACVKKNFSNSPSTPYDPNRSYDSSSSYTQYDNSPYIRPESANILASSYSCVTPLDQIDGCYITQLDGDYQRVDVLNIPDQVYATDGFLQKNNYLVAEQDDEFQYQHDPNRYQQLQCHNYNQNPGEQQPNSRNMNDTCIA